MNRQARIIALKLAVEILENSGEDFRTIEDTMSPSLEAEHLKLENPEETGEEMNIIIGKLKNNIQALENGFWPSDDGYLHLCRLD